MYFLNPSQLLPVRDCSGVDIKFFHANSFLEGHMAFVVYIDVIGVSDKLFVDLFCSFLLLKVGGMAVDIEMSHEWHEDDIHLFPFQI